jgi:hypothetical protein
MRVRFRSKQSSFSRIKIARHDCAACAAGAPGTLFALRTFRVTLFERRHLVHTVMVHGVPSTIAFTFLRLGFHFLLVLLIEWLTLLPNTVVLLHIAHLAIAFPPNYK